MCGKDLRIEPSLPTGDAPCPHCGQLLWFISPGGRTGPRVSFFLPRLSRVMLKGALAGAFLTALFAACWYWTGSVAHALILVVTVCLVFGKAAVSRVAFYLGRFNAAMRRRLYGV
jgi:hypothetical protein